MYVESKFRDDLDFGSYDFQETISPFVPYAPFLCSLKTSENLTFSDVFKR